MARSRGQTDEAQKVLDTATYYDMDEYRASEDGRVGWDVYVARDGTATASLDEGKLWRM